MSATIPVLQLRGNSVLVYQEAIFSRRFTNNHLARRRMTNAKKTQYSGTLTDGARKRMVKAVTLMCQATRPTWVKNNRGNLVWHHLSFMTLTVPGNQSITPAEAYKQVFQHFLQWLRRTKEVKMYVCVIEKQKRGQLHYHMIFPDYISHDEIRAEWNSLLHKAAMLDDFAAENGHFNPNSTEINEVRKKNDVAGYLVKELAKKLQKNFRRRGELEENEESKNSRGKVWYCSECFAGARYFSVVLSGRHENFLNAMRERGEVVKEVEEDFWSLICFDSSTGISPPDLLSEQERSRFQAHLDAIANPKEPEIFNEVTQEKIAIGTENLSMWKPVQCDLFDEDPFNQN